MEFYFLIALGSISVYLFGYISGFERGKRKQQKIDAAALIEIYAYDQGISSLSSAKIINKIMKDLNKQKSNVLKMRKPD